MLISHLTDEHRDIYLFAYSKMKIINDALYLNRGNSSLI